MRGTGGRTSFLASTSSATGLSRADAERISQVLKARAAQLPGDSIHAIMTGNGSPYQNIQSRIMWVLMLWLSLSLSLCLMLSLCVRVREDLTK